MNSINLMPSVNMRAISWSSMAQNPELKKVVSKAKKEINMIPMAIKMASIFRYTVNATKGLFGISKERYTFGGMRLLSFGNIPFAIHNTAKSACNFSKISPNERVDTALQITSHVGSIGDAIGSASQGLASVGAVAVQAVSWASPLAIVSTIIQLAGTVLSVKNYVEIDSFSKELRHQSGLDKDPQEYTLEDFRRGLDLIEKKRNEKTSFISTAFGTNEDKLADRLVAIELEARKALNSGNAEESAKARQNLQETMEHLSKRVTTKKWSISLTILAAAVSTAGFGASFSPAPPAGYALLGIGSLIGLGTYVFNRIKTRHFEASLGIDSD